MLSRTTSGRIDIMQPRCLACGSAVDHFAVDRESTCSRCGCDFLLRPPRSYAEMEGLIGEPVTIDQVESEPRISDRLIGRWALFVAFSLGLLISLLYLTAEVLRAV